MTHPFWSKNPALFYGLTLFLGYIFVLQTAWALLPFLFLIDRRRLLTSLLLFLLPSLITYQFYTFPPVETDVDGIFYITCMQKSERFGKGWIYQGYLKTVKGKLHCHCFSKQYHSPHYAYQIKGQLKARHTVNYKLKTIGIWEKVNKRLTLTQIRFEAQEKLKNYIFREIKQERAAQFLIGMTTGQMENQLMRKQLATLGLSHLLAISGLHFSLLALFFHIFLRLLLPSKIEACCLILLLSLYLLFIGLTPSIFRAWCVAMVFLIGQVVEKKSSSLNALGVALLVELIVTPLAASSLSFQLSFLATGGILFFFNPCQRLIAYWIPKQALKEVIDKHVIYQHFYILLSFFRQALALNIAVHLPMIPFLLATFHLFPISSLIYNLFFPFLAGIGLLFFLISIPLGEWAHAINGYYCEWMLKITQTPPLTFKTIYIEQVPEWVLTLILTILLVAAISLKIKKRSDRFPIADHTLLDHSQGFI